MRRSAVLALWMCGVWACSQPVRTVGGTVNGLDSAKSVRLKLASQSLLITANGSFVFPVPLDQGIQYEVDVQAQPTAQVCTVSNGTGIMGTSAISNVEVDCVDVNPSQTFPVQVQVSGLSGTLRLVDNNTDPLTVTRNGVYPFPTLVAGGAAYSVTVVSQPSGQVCVVSNPSGNVTTAAVTVGVVCGPAYLLTGTLTYDDVPAVESATAGVPKLDYANIASWPIRRALVQAIRSSDQLLLSETLSKDDGTYSLPVPQGATVNVWVRVESRVSAYAPDGIGPEHCAGTTWDVSVVDNTQGDAAYVLQSNSTYSAAATGADLHATTSYGTSSYTDRSGAPFALLDTALAELELVCEGDPAYTLPLLYIGWSPANTTDTGDPGQGQIGTSYFTPDPNDPTLSRLYILGDEDVDTDEYDSHVVAHEFGHFVEYRLYRSDSVGGDHGGGDILMPSVAFSEGYGNGVSGMVFDDPIYRDTNGVGQASGFDDDVSIPPTGNDQGIYSEDSVQYLLWSLYENRDNAPDSGSFDRLYAVLHNDQATTPALTSALSFAAYYHQRYGTSEGLQTLWTGALNSPWDALCAGSCAGSNTADPFDTDNDIGNAYAGTRNYPPATTTTQDAGFWQLFEPLSIGAANNPTGHDVILGYGDYPLNKWGYVRSYTLVGNGNTVNVNVQITGSQPSTCNSADDELDAYLYEDGAALAGDDSTDACPAFGFPSQASTTYVVLVQGEDQPQTSLTLVVQ